jgi:hypothetical protein
VRKLELQLRITKCDDSRRIRIIDAASDVEIAVIDMTPAQLVDLLGGETTDVSGELAEGLERTYIGRHREHDVHVPDLTGIVANIEHVTSPTVEMLYYGERYRETYGWDSATWHRYDDTSWHLHLVRWREPDSTTT